MKDGVSYVMELTSFSLKLNRTYFFQLEETFHTQAHTIFNLVLCWHKHDRYHFVVQVIAILKKKLNFRFLFETHLHHVKYHSYSYHGSIFVRPTKIGFLLSWRFFYETRKEKNTNGWNEPESADESDAFLVGYIRSLFLFENIAAQ